MEKKSEVINQYRGGLGNQMFQYAFGLNLEKQEKKVFVDTSWYHGKDCFGEEFRLNNVFPSVLLNWDEKKISKFNRYLAQRRIGTKIVNKILPFTNKIYFEKREFAYDIQALRTSKKVVSGYWQSYRYVHNVSQELRKQFIFIQTFSSELQALLDKIERSNAVFLHVRGGDYIKNPKAYNLYGNICIADYYKKAISMMKMKLRSPLFFVFTNDRPYAESIITETEDIYFISDFIGRCYEDWIDLMMMSKCKHAIIANSSFSWWGAWLIENKDKIVIAPEKWLNRKQDFDICEPDWIKM